MTRPIIPVAPLERSKLAADVDLGAMAADLSFDDIIDKKVLQSNGPQAIAGKKYESAMEYLMDIVNNPSITVDTRIRVAVSILPFQTPKLEAQMIGKKTQKVEAAKENISRFSPAQAPRLAA